MLALGYSHVSCGTPVDIEDVNHQEVIDDCRRAMNAWFTWFGENVDTYRQDLRFYGGQQWDDVTAGQYEKASKPTLVMDQVGPNIRKMMGQQKNADVTVNLLSRSTDSPQQNFNLLSLSRS